MKFKKLFVVFIIYLIFVPDYHNFVQAASITTPISGSTEKLADYKKAFSQNRELSTIANNINYDITKFDVSDNNSSLIFEGWSYVDHMDNWGGKNLRTWIIAYTGTWNSAWDSAIVSGTLANKGYYYATLATSTTKDLFFSRATNNGTVIEQDQINRVSATGYAWKNLGANKTTNAAGTGESSGRNGVYTIDWCLQLSGSTVHFNTDSRCLYYNVGFKVEVSTSEIANTIGQGKDVKIRILSSASYQQNSTCKADYTCSDNTKWKTYEKYESVDLGVYNSSLGTNLKPNCSLSGDGASCSRTTTYTNGNRKFTSTFALSLGGFAQNLNVTINGAKPYTDIDMKKELSPPSEVLKSISYGGSNFPIKDVSSDEKTICIDSNKKKCYVSRVFKIGVSKTTVKGTAPYSKFIVGGNDKSGWVAASWVRVSGTLTLKNFTLPESKPVCPPGPYCIGGACEQNKTVNADGCPSYQLPSKLQGTSCSQTAETNACTDYSFSTDERQCTKTYSAKYYYMVKESDISNVFPGLTASIVKNNGNTVEYVNGYYYFPIQFSANAKFSQSSQFQIVKGGTAGVTDEVINGSQFISGTTLAKAGRNFNYAFDYKISAIWNYSGIYSWETSNDNTYGGMIQVRLNDGNSVSVYVSLKNGEQLWYKNGNAWYSTVYNVDFYKNFVKQSVIQDYKNGGLAVTVAFSDSNDAKSTVNNTTAGIFSCNYIDGTSWDAGASKSANCTYRIKQAYIGRRNADVIYESSSDKVDLTKYDIGSDRGSLYYIPINLKNGELFKFTVESTNLSLINGINYSYKATCSVNVNNEYYDSGNIRYRPIDISNPFPEGENESNLAYNWNLYKKIDSNFLRIKNRSFSNLYYKTKQFSNSQIDELENLANLYGGYLSNDDIEESSGNSKVITNSLFDVINRSNKTHCISGNFSEDCDQG